MLKRLGPLIWMAGREMNVYNYPYHMIYEVYQPSGFLSFIFCKKTEAIEIIKGRHNMTALK
jgi:hypothetical protein